MHVVLAAVVAVGVVMLWLIRLYLRHHLCAIQLTYGGDGQDAMTVASGRLVSSIIAIVAATVVGGDSVNITVHMMIVTIDNNVVVIGLAVVRRTRFRRQQNTIRCTLQTEHTHAHTHSHKHMRTPHSMTQEYEPAHSLAINISCAVVG